MNGAITALGGGRAVAGRSTACRRVAEHLATHDLIAAQLRRRVVDLAPAAACQCFRRRSTDGRGATARRADGGIGAADVRTAVVHRSTTARGVRRGFLAYRSVAAEEGAGVVRGHSAGRGVHAATGPVDGPVIHAAVDRCAEHERTESVAGAADLLVVVVDRRTAAARLVTMNTASDHHSVATHLPYTRQFLLSASLYVSKRGAY